MKYKSHGPRCDCVECKMTGCGAFSSPAAALCEDCPPVDYPTDKTRCLPCPRRADT